MTIGGLTTILGKHPTNFKPIFLSDTPIVINALDFMGHLSEGISNAHGGENLAIHLKLIHVLSVFDQCRIVPYFVFAGGRENRGHQVNTRFLKTLKLLSNTDPPPDSTPRFQHSELPFGVKLTTVESLRKLRARFTFVPHSSLRCTASLAVRLNCPLIASSSDYFALVSTSELCNTTDDQPFRFVPLQYLNFQQISHPSCMLSAHEFLPNLSELATISPTHRPLLALLLGTDSMPRSRLPPHVQAVWHSQESSHPKERRFSMLVHWLSQYRTDTETPINQVIDAYPEAHRPNFIHQLTDCMAYYIYHPLMDSKGLTKQLEIPDLSPSESTDELTAALELTSFDTLYSQAPFVKEDAFNLLRGSRDDKVYLSDFTVGWPDRMVHAYRSGKFLSSFMRALYSSGFSMMSRTDAVSSDVCLPLRVMHYRIMFGLERQLGGCVKLIGLNPHATEYLVRDGKAVAYKIPVSPIVINISREQTDRLLGTLFSTTLPSTAAQPSWMLGLGAVLSYCKTHVPDSFGVVPLEQCSVVLALLGCAVVAADEPDSVGDRLNQHFTRVADEIAAQHENEVVSKTASFTELFVVVQRVYYAFNSLVNLLESMLPHTHESQLFHFLPAWNMFPSGRLVHWLAVDLDSRPPTTRQRGMSLCWLPRLCMTQPDVSVAKVRSLVSTFENVLEIASSLSMPRLSVKYDIREVPVLGLSTNNATHNPTQHSPKSDSQGDENKPHNPSSLRGTSTQRGTPFLKPRLSHKLHGSVASLPQNLDTNDRPGISPPHENGDRGLNSNHRRGSQTFRGRFSKQRRSSQYAERLRLRLEGNVQS